MKLTTLGAAWLAGMALAHGWYDADPLPLLILSGFAATAALVCRLLGISAWLPLLVVACLLGLWRYEVGQAVPPPLLADYGGSTQVRGRIVSDPEATATRVKFALKLTDIAGARAGGTPDWQPHDARLLIYAHPPPELVAERELPYFRYGDGVALTGTLQRPEPIEKFDYPAYLESQGIYAVFWAQAAVVSDTGAGEKVSIAARNVVFDLRRALGRSLEQSLPPTEAALARALLLGLRGQLPDTVVENFRQSGTSHLLAISGLHLGILLLMTVGVLHWALGRHTPIPVLLALVAVWLYVLVSGAPVSVVRAAIMGSVYLAALGLGRPRESLLPALALSVVVMTALDSGAASRISFQLSFAAIAGIALALPWQDTLSRSIASRVEQTGWRWSPLAGTALAWLASGVLISVAATLATFPLVALNFGRLPLLGIPATILATPLLPFALAGGLITALAGLVHPLVGQLVGLPASMPLAALLALVEGVPKWAVELDTEGTGWLWAWYGVLLGALVLADTRWYRAGVLRRLTRVMGLSSGAGHSVSGSGSVGACLALGGVGLVLAATLFYLLAGVGGQTDGRLHVFFLDVGQGDAIYIETPSGKQVLVDGGPEFGGAARALSRHLPPWDRSLDLVASTHLDTDHSRGLLRVLESYKTGTVVAGLPDTESHLYPQWQKAVEEGGHRLVHLSAGQELALEEGLTLTALHPPAVPLRGPAWESNNNSLVLRLSYGEISFLLTGDIEAEAERYLARTATSLQSEVLKAGHHGSKSSTTAAFLRAVKPRWAVISAGADNQYGHPHAEVVSRLEDVVGRANVFSTATQGTIHFITDGQRLWVETER